MLGLSEWTGSLPRALGMWQSPPGSPVLCPSLPMCNLQHASGDTTPVPSTHLAHDLGHFVCPTVGPEGETQSQCPWGYYQLHTGSRVHGVSQQGWALNVTTVLLGL